MHSMQSAAEATGGALGVGAGAPSRAEVFSASLAMLQNNGIARCSIAGHLEVVEAISRGHRGAVTACLAGAPERCGAFGGQLQATV